MHNLKTPGHFRGIVQAGERSGTHCEPSESENKTNDGNDSSYGRVLIWLTKSLPFPSLSPASLLLTH